MATRKSSMPTKNHILAVSARLMLEQGYRDTTMKQIASTAGVAVCSVQNFFRNKEGLIAELVKLMFSGQFSAAKQSAEASLPPTFTYAAETAIWHFGLPFSLSAAVHSSAQQFMAKRNVTK